MRDAMSSAAEEFRMPARVLCFAAGVLHTGRASIVYIFGSARPFQRVLLLFALRAQFIRRTGQIKLHEEIERLQTPECFAAADE